MGTCHLATLLALLPQVAGQLTMALPLQLQVQLHHPIHAVLLMSK